MQLSVASLINSWRAALGNPRRHSATSRLLELLPDNPILGIKEVMMLTGQSESSARRAIQRLEYAGIVRALNIAPGKSGWEVVGVFKLLDDLERDRSDRRRAPRHTN